MDLSCDGQHIIFSHGDRGEQVVSKTETETIPTCLAAQFNGLYVT